MKRWMTTLTLSMLLLIPSLVFAQGTYLWKVSASDTDPNVQTGPDGTGGLNTVFLWYVEACNPGNIGMSAADIGLRGLGDWNIIAFNVANGFLNAGGPTSLLLAVGDCPDPPIVAGSILATGNAGGVNLGVGANSPEGMSSTVDCAVNPAQYFWPTQVRFMGFQTVGIVQPAQNHGASCSATSVEESSWGSVKSLYR